MEDLQSNHHQAITMLAEGYHVKEVARTVRVTPRQIYRWLNWEPFKEELETQKRRIFEAGIAKLINCLDIGVEALSDEAQNGKGMPRVTAAKALFDGAFRYQEKELERRLERVEAQINQADEND